MWELALACRRTNFYATDYIYNIINKYITDGKLILTKYNDKNFEYVLFACEWKDKSKYEPIIKQAIINYIVDDYKCNYLKKRIKLEALDNFSYDAYIKVLSLFDKSSDQKLLENLIILNQTFFVDSFIEFRISQLMDRWNELCDLAQDNSSYFVNSGTFLEIIRFLVNSMDTNCKKIKILCNEGAYSIYHSADNIEEVVEKIGESYGKLDLISKVLSISPMNIDVYVTSSADDEAVGFLSDIYMNRLKIFTN